MAALDNDSDSELELEEKQFTIGAHTFQVHVVGELPLETLFALESKRDEISGQRAWPGSLLLAAEVAARPALVEDRAVVELGAGAGLCAMVAARCGARTTAATDGDDRCLDLLRRNVAANGLDGGRRFKMLLGPRRAARRRPRPVLAGDVLYKRALVEPFLDALEAALAPGGRALLCHLPRAGVSHEVVEAALRAREGRRRAPRWPPSARRHLPSSATTAPPTTRRRRASTSFACRRRTTTRTRVEVVFAVRVSNLANRVDLSAVQNLFRGCGVALVCRSGPREAVVCLNDESRRRAGAAARRVGGSGDGDLRPVTRMNAAGGGNPSARCRYASVRRLVRLLLLRLGDRALRLGAHRRDLGRVDPGELDDDRGNIVRGRLGEGLSYNPPRTFFGLAEVLDGQRDDGVII